MWITINMIFDVARELKKGQSPYYFLTSLASKRYLYVFLWIFLNFFIWLSKFEVWYILDAWSNMVIIFSFLKLFMTFCFMWNPHRPCDIKENTSLTALLMLIWWSKIIIKYGRDTITLWSSVKNQFHDWSFSPFPNPKG